MSCYICDKTDIDAIVELFMPRLLRDGSRIGKLILTRGVWNEEIDTEATQEERDELGRVLWKMNLESVAYRYPNDVDGDRPGPVDFRDSDVDTYTWSPSRSRPTTTRGRLEKLGTLLYQSSEAEWASEWAKETYRLVEWAEGRVAVQIIRAEAREEATR